MKLDDKWHFIDEDDYPPDDYKGQLAFYIRCIEYDPEHNKYYRSYIYALGHRFGQPLLDFALDVALDPGCTYIIKAWKYIKITRPRRKHGITKCNVAPD